MNVEIGTEAPIPFLGIFVSKFRYFVFAVYVHSLAGVEGGWPQIL
jgi:hypothetical protein